MTITVEDLKRKSAEIFASAPDMLSGFRTFQEWLAANEKYLDKDAGKFLDRFFEQMSSEAISNVSKMAESKEKRSLMRQAAAIGDKHFKANNLLEAIQRSPQTTDEITTSWSENMLQMQQAILNLLFDVVHSTSKEKQPIVFTAFCYSCVDELTAALHLAGHHYYVQASNHLRTVIETIDRMDFFRKYPEMIDVWAGNDKKKILKELKPSAIRKKLGRDVYDPLYGYLSEIGTHPTFDMFKARAEIDGNDSSTARIFVSGTPLEHLRLFYFPISLLVASALLGCVMRTFKGLHNDEECIEMTQATMSQMREFVSKFFLPAFPTQDQKAQEFLAVFDKFLASLEDPSIVIVDPDIK